MIFSCAVSFESKKKKIPDLSLPPCILMNKYTADSTLRSGFVYLRIPDAWDLKNKLDILRWFCFF